MWNDLISKRVRLSVKVSFLLLILGSIVLTTIMLLLQVNGVMDLASCLVNSYFLMFILNWIPIFLSMLFVYFLSGNLVVAEGSVGFIIIVLSVINRFKMIFRYDPLMPWDFLLGGEFLGIARSFSMKLIAGTILGFMLILFCVVVCAWVVKNKKPSIKARLAGILITAGVFLVSNQYLLSNYQINRWLPVIGNIYNQMNQYNSKGFIYQFMFSFNTGKITKPNDYDEEKMREYVQSLEEEQTSGTEAIKPHVFVILGEAFSEIPMHESLNYEGYKDPLQHYKNIKKQSDTGYLIVPGIGGGTADTEFDILTGINIRNYRGVPYGNMLITKKMNGLPNIFRSIGYKTTAIHPGYAWFYNRQNVYPFLGFDEFTSLDDFQGASEKGSYISEEATYDEMINQFEKHVTENEDVPLFNFVVTIQNHGPYENKYSADRFFQSDQSFSDADVNSLSNYVYGVTDMDEQLNRFVEYMSKTDEPVIIAYYGDHLPLLSQEIYDGLVAGGQGKDTVEEKMKLYRTPYLMWSNDAAKQLVNVNNDFAHNGQMSSFYFGATLLEYLGFDKVDPFFAYLIKIKREFPVILQNEYYTTDGKLHEINNEKQDTIDLYRQWSYYRIFDTIEE